mgnify:CR=1 FL=1
MSGACISLGFVDMAVYARCWLRGLVVGLVVGVDLVGGLRWICHGKLSG